MAWKIEYESDALKDLKKLDRQIAKRIVAFLRDRVAPLEDPAASVRHYRDQSWANCGAIASAITGSSASFKIGTW